MYLRRLLAYGAGLNEVKTLGVCGSADIRFTLHSGCIMCRTVYHLVLHMEHGTHGKPATCFQHLLELYLTSDHSGHSITNPFKISPLACLLPYARNTLKRCSSSSPPIIHHKHQRPRLGPSLPHRYLAQTVNRPPFTENGPLYILPPRLQPTLPYEFLDVVELHVLGCARRIHYRR
jgi:hypothetical protein